MWSCYFIRSTTSNRTYNGSTNNLTRRLRQHNGEIKGGAYRTQIGRPWEYFAVLSGLPNHINALSCEWRLRYPSNKHKKESKYKGINGRIIGLNDVLKLDKWTNQCTISNQDMNLQLYILPEFSHLLDHIPSNIYINIVEHI